MLFPQVKKLEKYGEYSFDGAVSVSLCESDIEYEKLFDTVFGGISSPEGKLVISCKKAAAEPTHGQEEYSLVISEKGGKVFSEVSAYYEEGIMRGLQTIKRMLLKNEFILGNINDYPSFKVRGYIEGFYGKPWKARERLEMLSLMALFGENTHYYAPKDDPYHRDKWREPYPEKKAAELKRLIDKAKSLYVELYYCIAPGLSMKYSSDEELQALFDKTRQLFSMGIKNFGLLLDDIPSDLFYEEDKKRYGNAVRAHIELIGKYFSFLKSLSPECRLTVCPTAYHGKGDERELTGLTGNIPSEVSVFYTGNDICSKEITRAEAEYFEKNNNRQPLYWDNYPVNDAEMFMEMHIGPVIGRDKELYKSCEGIISNCMEYFNCNKFSLITLAAYMWSPEDYEPERAFSDAVSFMLPENEREAFVLLADQFRTSCLHDENSRIMGEYLSAASVRLSTGNYESALEILTEYTDKINSAAVSLSEKSSPLYKELSRWIKKFILMSDILTLALSVIKGEDKKAELKRKMRKYNESATVLTAFCFREFIESVLDYEN